MVIKRTWIAVAAMIVAISVCLWAFGKCGHPATISRDTKALDDSLTRTAPAFDSGRAARRAREDSLTRAGHVKEAVSHAAELSGARLREIAAARADSARRHAATAADSARFYRQAYEGERAAGIETTRALWEERAAHDATRRALAVADSTIHEDSTRLDAQARDISLLKRDLARATDCRLVFGLSCPSRRAAFLAGAAVATTAAVVAYRAAGRDRVVVVSARIPYKGMSRESISRFLDPSQ